MMTFVNAAMVFAGLLVFGTAVAVGPRDETGFWMLFIGCALLAFATVRL